MRREPSQRELIAYLEQKVTPSEAARLEARLADSASARRRLAELRDLRAALATPWPEVERVDLVASVHKAIAAPMPRPPLRELLARRLLWFAVPAVFSAIVLLGFFSPHLPGVGGGSPGARPAGPDEFRARAAAPPGTEAEHWVALQIYRKGDDRPPERVRERIKAGDGLLFAYTNLGPQPFAHLMIFAVSSQGDVYWFYPEYRDSTTDPSSVRIREAQAEAELPDLVHHRLAPGPVAIYGLFTRTSLRVSEVEKAVAQEKQPGRRLPVPGSAQYIVTVEVVP